MIKLMKRWWSYTTAKLTGAFNEAADPKVQLEQAIQEAQDQHRRLKEQAANVIANQKQTEIRLNRTMEEYEKISSNARQAVLMADDAMKKGDDGSITLYFQKDSPGKGLESNWLPAPNGPFYMLMRVYWPEKAFLDGSWKLPAIQKAK